MTIDFLKNQLKYYDLFLLVAFELMRVLTGVQVLLDIPLGINKSWTSQS